MPLESEEGSFGVRGGDVTVRGDVATVRSRKDLT